MKTVRALALALAVTFSVVAPLAGAVSMAVAQEGPQEGAPRGESPEESRAASFQAVTGPTTEDVPGGTLMVAAYGTILVLLLGYVAWIARLQSTTQRDLTRLEKALVKAGASKTET